MKKQLVLIGGGGHCKVCIDIIEQTEQFEIVGILDLAKLVGKTVLGYKILGSDQDIPKYIELGYSFLVTVGQIKSPLLRKTLFDQLKEKGANIATVISKSCYLSKYAKVGIGTIAMHNVTINAGAEIGENCVLNNGCDIEHDSVIGNHTHISTGAIVNGDCKIGNAVFVGSNATIANQISITDNVIIGAGAVVIRDLIIEETYIGNPAKRTNA